MAAEARSIVVHGDAAALRRRLGDPAWAALEELLAQSSGLAMNCVAVVTVRSLASDLGVSKDTVARALARLRDAGIVTAEQSRASTGMFTIGSYRIAVPSCIAFTAPAAPTSVNPRPLPLASRVAIAQRSLFDLDASTP